MAQQTAVEWIVEQLDIISKHDIDGEERYIVIQMAKEMEKKQIIKAVNYGCDDYGSQKDGEEYYNETYGTE